TSGGSTPLYSGSPLVAADSTIRYGWLPSAIASSTPVTTTVCGELQFALVNTSCEIAIVPSVRSLDATGIVTSAVGCDSKTTVNCAVPPASVVIRPLVGETRMPPDSSSRFVHDTSAGSSPA